MDPRTGALLALAGIAFSAAAAARLDDEDHHLDGRARGRDRQAARHLPDQHGRRRSTATRCTTPAARPAAARFLERVRGLVQLGVRAARGQARRQAAGRHGRALRLQPAARRSPARPRATIPSASTIGGDLAVGSSAIGQGKVQASALEMTDVGGDDRDGRPAPAARRCRPHQPPRFVHVTSRHVAGQVQQMMVAVVAVRHRHLGRDPGRHGGRQDRHRRARRTPPTATGPNAANADQDDRRLVRRLRARWAQPRIVVGALFPNQGAGGATAAPAVREVLDRRPRRPH